MLTANVERWRDAGSFEEVDGRRLYVQRRQGEGPLLLFLHGFPSSSYDWRELLALRPDRAALLFDFLGFGLSDKPADVEYTLAWQADAAEELVRRAGSPPVYVVAHDMGTSVATELFARELRGNGALDIRGALLFNGSILLDRASPTTGQKLLRSPLGSLFARLTTQRSFRLQFGRIFSDAHPLSRAEADDQWALLAHNQGHRIGHLLVNYMAERERYVERWHGAFRDWPGRLSLTWGLEDPVATTAVLDGLRELRPGIPVMELPGIGHYPQLERPDLIAAALDAGLADV
ncbi:MAG TPA: alpha/beta hydrolase [Conexibacter sp.]|jgi:pimeloyl-ACP methyl ester carboxylesterase|nr:alpha/beta hydrolase [Conexibacter sp.]